MATLQKEVKAVPPGSCAWWEELDSEENFDQLHFNIHSIWKIYSNHSYPMIENVAELFNSNS